MRTVYPQRLAVVIAALAMVVALGRSSAGAESDALPPVGHTVEGKHFRILCHFENEAVARQGLAAAEAAWAPTVEVLGKEPALDDKIEIHLLRTPEVYRAVEKDITNGKFERNNAFSSWTSRAAYVALEPVYDDALLERIGLTSQTRRTIAHEAAHLIVYHTWSSYRHHPAWLAEGIAIWAADTVLVPGAKLPALGARPIAAKRMVRYRQQVEDELLPDLRDVIAWNRYRDLGFNDRYAFWWGFFRYLYTGPRAKAFRGVLGKIGAMPAGGAFPGALRTAMTQAFADEDGSFDTLYAELMAFGRELPGEWDEVVRTLDVRGTTWWQLAFPKSNAVCWRRERADRQRYRIHGTLEIQPGGVQQLNVLLARDVEQGFLSVAYRAGVGVTILRYDQAEEAWKTLAFGEQERIEIARTYPFAVHVADGKLIAFLDGKAIVSAEVEDHPLDGAWGLGVQASGAGAWKDVRLERRR